MIENQELFNQNLINSKPVNQKVQTIYALDNLEKLLIGKTELDQRDILFRLVRKMHYYEVDFYGRSGIVQDHVREIRSTISDSFDYSFYSNGYYLEPYFLAMASDPIQAENIPTNLALDCFKLDHSFDKTGYNNIPSLKQPALEFKKIYQHFLSSITFFENFEELVKLGYDKIYKRDYQELKLFKIKNYLNLRNKTQNDTQLSDFIETTKEEFLNFGLNEEEKYRVLERFLTRVVVDGSQFIQEPRLREVFQDQNGMVDYAGVKKFEKYVFNYLADFPNLKLTIPLEDKLGRLNLGQIRILEAVCEGIGKILESEYSPLSLYYAEIKEWRKNLT